MIIEMCCRMMMIKILIMVVIDNDNCNHTGDKARDNGND